MVAAGQQMLQGYAEQTWQAVEGRETAVSILPAKGKACLPSQPGL